LAGRSYWSCSFWRATLGSTDWSNGYKPLIFSISDLRSQTCVYMTPREYRDHTVPSHTVPSCLLHCIYTMHHAHILLVYSITPHSTTASHSTPLLTLPLYSLIHVDPRWPGAASTLSAARLHAVLVCWARPSPLQCCALVQYSGGAIYGDGVTITLSDCTFNKNTAVRNQ
jgi:hypothetical protein